MVDYVRLAGLLTERLRPVLPVGMAVDVGTPEYVDHIAARRFGGPRLRHAMGVVVVSSADGPGDRYEADAAVDGADIRVWFGLVPPMATLPWRAVLPELPSIPIPTAG
jgi:hypothetical protein